MCYRRSPHQRLDVRLTTKRDTTVRACSGPWPSISMNCALVDCRPNIADGPDTGRPIAGPPVDPRVLAGAPGLLQPCSGVNPASHRRSANYLRSRTPFGHLATHEDSADPHYCDPFVLPTNVSAFVVQTRCIAVGQAGGRQQLVGANMGRSAENMQQTATSTIGWTSRRQSLDQTTAGGRPARYAELPRDAITSRSISSFRTPSMSERLA
jgi:hypothetical protein